MTNKATVDKEDPSSHPTHSRGQWSTGAKLWPGDSSAASFPKMVILSSICEPSQHASPCIDDEDAMCTGALAIGFKYDCKSPISRRINSVQRGV
jgi:hypothetical protein